MEQKELYNKSYSVLRRKCRRGHYQQLSQQHFRQIRNTIPLSVHDTVLEVGCDEGYLLRLIEHIGAQVQGIEVNPYAVQQAHHPHILYGRAEEIPFPDQSFTVCIALHVIEHLENPHTFLSEAARVLVPSGRLVLIYPWELFQGMSVIPEVILSKRSLLCIRQFHRHLVTPRSIKVWSKGLKLSHVVSRMFWGWPHITPQYITVFQRTE
ncbi:MAG: class I SAM-dependent methyltransferase [Patescibacteria group bacterium]